MLLWEQPRVNFMFVIVMVLVSTSTGSITVSAIFPWCCGLKEHANLLHRICYVCWNQTKVEMYYWLVHCLLLASISVFWGYFFHLSVVFERVFFELLLYFVAVELLLFPGSVYYPWERALMSDTLCRYTLPWLSWQLRGYLRSSSFLPELCIDLY